MGSRLLATALVLAVALAAAGVSAVAWILGTDQGAAWLVEVAETQARGRLEIERVDGTLLHGLTLTGVALRLPRGELRVEDAVLSWDARALLGGAVVFDAARATTVTYRRQEGQSEGAPSGVGFRLPVPIEVRDAVIDALMVEVGAAGMIELGQTRVAGRAAGTALRLERLETSARGIEVTGHGEVSFAAGATRLDTELLWRSELAGEVWAGGGTLRGELPELTVAHRLTLPFDVLAEGMVTVAEAPRADLTLVWSDLAPPGTDLVLSPSGTARVQGILGDYRFEGSGALIVDGEALRFIVAGGGAGPRLSLDALTLTPAEASAPASAEPAVMASGEVAFDAGTWDLRVEGRDLDPAQRFAAWPGRIAGRGRLTGRVWPEVAWRVSQLELDGELREFPFAARGDVAREDGLWHLEGVHVSSGPNELEVAGTAGEALALRLAGRFERLDALWPGLEGTLVGEIALGGTMAEPHARGRLDGSALALGDYAVRRLNVVSDFGTADGRPLEVVIDGAGLRRGGVEVAAFRGRLAGVIGNHEIVVEARGDQWEGRLGARGGLEHWVWQGAVDTLDVRQGTLGEWRLSGPTALTWGRGVARVAGACLVRVPAELCGTLQLVGSADDRLEVSVEAFDLRALDPWLPDGFGSEGIYTASLVLTNLGRRPRGRLSVEGGSTALRLLLPGQSGLETRVEDVRLTAALDGGALTLNAGLSGRDTGAVELSVRVADVANERSPVEGQLSVFWSDLRVLALLSPDVRDVAGTLGVDLALGGTLAEPAIEGRAALDDGEIRVPDLGLHVRGIHARGTSADGSTLRFTATGVVDDAELRVGGETQLDPAAGWPTRLTLDGQSIPAVRLPDAEIFVSPNLDAEIRLPDIRVGGTVHVPRARVTLQELPVQAVTPSADAIVHGVAQPEAPRPLRMRADLQLTLGDDVRYSGMNLETVVTGEMRLAYTSGRPATASGVVSLDGEYNAYGQPLGLERGELIFTGPLGDPALDVRAVRQIGDENTVGVQLTGTLKNPQTRIFSTRPMSESNRPMSETEALSYLVFGRPLTNSGSDDSQVLQSAAIAMGLQQALPMVQRIGQSLGFDEFTVRTTADDAGALMAGKYLTPDLYVRYSYGLFNRIGGLLLRFRVNERLSLETRSGDEKAMDLLYTVEKH